MKKTVAFLLCIILVLCCLAGCSANQTVNVSYQSEVFQQLQSGEKEKYSGVTLNVFNWGEYISDGKGGSLNVNRIFEKLTGIKVNYLFYDSNETMYSKLKSGGISYDIIIPSDYMIQRLISEDMLQKLDFSKLDNYKNISDEYKNLYFDPNNEYSVPYSVGMVGLIYNETMIDEVPDSWGVMWDEKYKNNVLTFNNPRDAFAIAQFYLGQDINSTNQADWDKAAEKLKEQKPILQSYVMDEVFDKMEGEEAAIAPYYAGDYLSMAENNENLKFVYPKEGTNIFVDSICVPKNAQNFDAAMLYINFLLEAQIALQNAEYIYYATPNAAVLELDDYSLKDNEYLYPAEDKKPKTQYFHDLDSKTRSYYEKLWEQVKLD
ncbi:MAG: spermidine/putrescine ABC transporter substrate-binding protein [Clostridia bacterium]|nr:spermidine/putrescine ABC transporter substrate-binding protein [Clostridia bacterium]